MSHRSKEILQRLSRLFNHKVTLDKGTYRAKFILPGFHYGDFDRAGNVNMYSLNRLMETSRLAGYSKQLQHSFPTYRMKDTVMMMFSQRFTVSPTIYQKAVMDFPIAFQNRIAAVGRSSLVRELTLTDQESGEVLITALQKVVNSDRSTMKSRPLAPKVLEFYDRIADKESHEVYENVHPPEVNASTKMFSTERKVRHSDMDMLFHANQATYMRYSLDCASEAVAAGALSAFRDDLCFYHAKEAATIHLAESFAGDIVGVHTWEDIANPKVLHFSVTKNIEGRSQIIYYSYIEYIN